MFGNMGENCGTGVAFTRNPSTGEKTLYGEYLMNAQGEDVVAGIRTPQPISKLKEEMPETYKEFERVPPCWKSITGICRTWSSPSSDGKLYMLQTRSRQTDGGCSGEGGGGYGGRGADLQGRGHHPG